MPSKVQLFTPEQIKAAAAIDQNVYPEDIEVAAKWVQDESVERVLGTPLFNRIIDLKESGAIDNAEYSAYKALVDDYILYIVGWGVRADVQPLLHNKVRNAGVNRSTDEHVDAVDQDDMYRNINRYEKRRDAYVQKTAEYLHCHAAEFPEYAPCDCTCGGQSPERGTGSFPFGIYVE